MNKSDAKHAAAGRPAHGGNPEAVARSLGMSGAPPIRYDFSVIVNPLGPPPCLQAVLAETARTITRYPQPYAEHATTALANAHDIDPAGVLVGNGSTEIFGWIAQALAPRNPAWIVPTYTGYEEACRAAGRPGHGLTGGTPESDFAVPIDAIRNTDADMLFLGSPNNPTGVTLEPDVVMEAARARSKCRFVIDESFMDFLPHGRERSMLQDGLPPNVIVVKSLTKFFALPGLRLGMACAHPATAEAIRAAALPWSVNAFAQAAALRLYADATYAAATRRTVTEQREIFVKALSELSGCRVFPARANFVLVRLPPDWTANRLQTALLTRGMLIRSCAHIAGLGEPYVRLAVRPPDEAAALLEALRDLIGMPDGLRPPRPRRGGGTTPALAPPTDEPAATSAHTAALMVVGTTSHAGKSVVAAALCRLFARRGVDVAPFKAQNMALTLSSPRKVARWAAPRSFRPTPLD